MFLLLLLLFFSCQVLPLSTADITVARDVGENDVTTPRKLTEVETLRAELKKLRKAFFKFKKGSANRGKKKMCEMASEQLSDKISMELSGLRTQIHTSDSVKSLRSELEYGLATLRSELDNKASSLRAELDVRLTDFRAELQGAIAEGKAELNSELTDVRAELQYNLNQACSGDKEVTSALTELKASVQTVKSELEGRVGETRSELEQRMAGVRSDLEAGLNTARAQFKTDVVGVRSDLQDMLSDMRTELRDNVAGTRSELQTGMVAAQSGLQNSLHSLQADILDVSSQTQTDLASLKAQVTGLSAVVKAEVQTELVGTKTQLEGTMQRLEDDLGKQLGHVADSVQKLATSQSQLVYNVTTLANDLARVRSQAQRDMTTLKSDVEGEVSKLESKVDEAVHRVTLRLDKLVSFNTSTASSPNVSAIGQRLALMQNDVDTRFADLRVDLDTKIDNLMIGVKDAGGKMAADCADQSSRLLSMARDMNSLQEALDKGQHGKKHSSDLAAGSTFVRWGRTDCSNNSQLVYSGVVGGSSYDTRGGAANRLCLTLTPQAGNVSGARTYLYGAEYKFGRHHDMDVVCAVCHSPLSVTIMVPGTQACPSGWHVQYRGHLTAGMAGHRAASQYLCLDERPQHRAGSQQVRNGALFYYVFSECGSLPCPPYTPMYLSCVVCSR